MQKTLITTLIFAILVAIFAVMNSAPVSINFGFAEFQSFQSVVILISATLGAIIAFASGMFSRLKLKKNIKELNAKVKTLEADLEKHATVEVKPSSDLEIEQKQVDKDDSITQ